MYSKEQLREINAAKQIPNPFAQEMAQKYYQQIYPNGFIGNGFQGEPINIKPLKWWEK